MKHQRKSLTLLLALCMLAAAGHVWLKPETAVAAAVADWPQFLGPDRNGVYVGALGGSWPAAGPRVVWKKQVGAGFAGPVVAGKRLIIFHRVRNGEGVGPVDAKTGNAQWGA